MADVKRGFARYPGDQVWLAYPPGVQKQLDAGRLQVKGQYQARADIEASQTPESAMPKGNQSHETWLAYAVSQGMPRDEAAQLTRDQIKEIAEKKIVDLNCASIESAMAMIEGSARSMGLEVVG